MDFNNIRLIYFSPTKTTKKIVETIAQGINLNVVKHMNLTSFKIINSKFKELNNELAIIGVPVYSGRIPVDAAKRLRIIKGNNSPAVIVTVYGNRNYDDALLELRDTALEIGFRPFAAATFIGEHSFSSENFSIAHGRPDNSDLNKATEFGEKIRSAIKNNKLIDDIINVPGKYPYREYIKFHNVSPVTIDSICTKCGVCIKNCPTNAIHPEEKIITDEENCIVCCACIKYCPNNARINDNELIKSITEWLTKNCFERKEPVIYISL